MKALNISLLSFFVLISAALQSFAQEQAVTTSQIEAYLRENSAFTSNFEVPKFTLARANDIYPANSYNPDISNPISAQFALGIQVTKNSQGQDIIKILTGLDLTPDHNEGVEVTKIIDLIGRKYIAKDFVAETVRLHGEVTTLRLINVTGLSLDTVKNILNDVLEVLETVRAEGKNIRADKFYKAKRKTACAKMF